MAPRLATRRRSWWFLRLAILVVALVVGAGGSWVREATTSPCSWGTRSRSPPTTEETLRRQVLWALTSGTAGDFVGSDDWEFHDPDGRLAVIYLPTQRTTGYSS
ncbi:MAG: hypothetical protein ACRDTG_26880 [Pseudonocardiaceae bacterium]